MIVPNRGESHRGMGGCRSRSEIDSHRWARDPWLAQQAAAAAGGRFTEEVARERLVNGLWGEKAGGGETLGGKDGKGDGGIAAASTPDLEERC